MIMVFINQILQNLVMVDESKSSGKSDMNVQSALKDLNQRYFGEEITIQESKERLRRDTLVGAPLYLALGVLCELFSLQKEV